MFPLVFSLHISFSAKPSMSPKPPCLSHPPLSPLPQPFLHSFHPPLDLLNVVAHHLNTGKGHHAYLGSTTGYTSSCYVSSSPFPLLPSRTCYKERQSKQNYKSAYL
ncbi:hypothetical protein GLYMA_09G253450v4 [Glycine max]|nr:hypothetical protein GLYMA_09G253450v4 [Glycine max]